MASVEPQTRLSALRKLLNDEKMSTQDELRDELRTLDFEVTQSTVSRDLRRLGAIKAIDQSGRTVYRLPTDLEPSPIQAPVSRLADMITEIRHNGAMIVIHTTPGSASLLARHIDQNRFSKVIGTIAGDDTIFVAPSQTKDITKALQQITESLL
jgi:transcriptional regulator of arginine metabolism